MSIFKQRQQQHREAIKAEAARRGIKVTQRGQVWRLSGQGVSLLIADLKDVDLRDLDPHRYASQE